MPSSSRSTHRISGAAELLDAIPYLLGFHPDESLVLVGVRDGMLGASARLDLTDSGQLDLLDRTVAALHRGGADRLVVVVFDDHCDPPVVDVGDGLAAFKPWEDAVLAVDEAATRVGVPIVEAMLVCHDRWWSYLCYAAGCCPGEGNPLAAGPTPFATAAAYDGIVALPSRAALASTLEPLPQVKRAGLEPLVAAAEDATTAALLEDHTAQHERALVRELLRTARASTLAGWQPPDDTTTARLVAALSTTAIRDEAWIAVDSGRLDARPLWADLARRSPEPYDAAPMFLLAWASWRDGNGALAGMAVERVLASDPTYSAADLLQAALRHAVDPRTFPLLTDSGLRPTLRARRRPGRRAGAARKPR